MLAWIIEKWDWFIYFCAYASMKRMCARDPGFAYLLELWISEYRKQNPISEQSKRAIELFFATQRDKKKP